VIRAIRNRHRHQAPAARIWSIPTDFSAYPAWNPFIVAAGGERPHSGLAMLISRISRRISAGTVGRPERGRDFQRQYDLNPARCQRKTVSGFTIVRLS
jgi:hypothetical protein